MTHSDLFTVPVAQHKDIKDERNRIMQTLHIRPFDYDSDADYEARARIHNLVWRDLPESIEEITENYRISRQEPYIRERFLGEVDSQAVAFGTYGQTPWALVPGKYGLDIEVIPEMRRQGLGKQMLAYLTEHLSHRDPAPTHYLAGTREDQTDALAWLQKLGYQWRMRYPRSMLYVPDFDFEKFTPSIAAAEAKGFRLVSLSTLRKEDPDWKQKFYELTDTLEQDVPSPDPPTSQPLEEFERYLSHPSFCFDGQFIAVDTSNGTWAASSGVGYALADPKLLWTYLTGTRREYRRKGLAMALKTLAVGFARAYGAERIETDNEENNPMYTLNMHLGYKPLPAWADYERPVVLPVTK